MNILVLGAGAREHVLAHVLSRDPKVTQVYVSPGNGGMEKRGSITVLGKKTTQALITFCQDNNIAYTVVGPEALLNEGIVDSFQKAGLKIFGPTKKAAQLESSKEFAKKFMQRHQIPTAPYRSFHTSEEILNYIRQHSFPVVLKADGLASGKGVIVAHTLKEAEDAFKTLQDKFSDKIIMEDFLEGKEASLIVLSDGEHVYPLPLSQDHKRLLDNDQGPNTGGMGAYSPVPWITEESYRAALKTIVYPTIAGMKQEGHPFVGFLYVGLMIDSTGKPYTVEFNARLGDPETLPILLRVEEGLQEAIALALEGRLDQAKLEISDKSVVAVVIASKSYPLSISEGDVITGTEEAEQKGRLFYAGVKKGKNGLETSGGRILAVVGEGNSVEKARQNAYRELQAIHFRGMQSRTDLAQTSG